MVEPRTDNADRYRDQGDVQSRLLRSAQRPIATVGPPHRHENACKYAQGVGAQRERADVPHPLGGTRNRSDEHSENLSMGGGDKRGMAARSDQFGDELLGIGRTDDGFPDNDDIGSRTRITHDIMRS